MRLIDADVLMGKLTMSNIAHSQNSRELSLLNRNLKIVMDMPTAYDVEKVERQLYAEAFCYEDLDGEGYYLELGKALWIVSDGGKE